MAKRYKIGEVADPADCIIWEKAKSLGGYPLVWRDGKTQSYLRWRWKRDIGPIPDGMFMCHHCDNPSCTNVEHLFLGTRADNFKDSFLKGRARHAIGEEHGLAKMTVKQVKGIRKDYADGMRVFELVKKYGLTRTPINRIISRETWKHVE